MVCVNQAFLLDGFIIQGREKNVNGPAGTFTICLLTMMCGHDII